MLDLEFATGKPADQLHDELRRGDFFRAFLERRLEGVEVDIRYPTYMFEGVLCTHGHYLDFHARRAGAAPGKLLARALWSIAVGGKEHAPTIEDYEATITMLTGFLYTVAQLPNGTHAQQRVFGAFQTLERNLRLGTAPVRAVEHLAAWLAKQAGGATSARWRRRTQAELAGYQGARTQEAARRRQTGAPTGGEVASYAMARIVRPSDPSGAAVEAFEKVVQNLGWARRTDKIVFAHTHQPLAAATVPGGTVRYWNTGSWIYEPDLSSRESYLAYLRNAWPGTVVLIDSEEPEPRLLRLREHLNPLSTVHDHA
jgi:UDP-2,3-diacylglucosamine pyrophosphatase LpxH